MPKLQTYDPLSETQATRQDLKDARNTIEGLPVLANSTPIDIDERSELRMREALEFWDIVGEETINWTLADGTVRALNKEQLESLLLNARILRANRAAQVHLEYRNRKLLPQTLRDCQDWIDSYKL